MSLPDVPTPLQPAIERVSVGAPERRAALAKPPASPTEEDLKKAQQEEADRAKYKIEVLFHRNRSSLSHKPSPAMILIWESGRRLHGGGDEKMYWCGYPDCGRPMPSDDFGYMHVVCRHCQKEQFLDPDARALHIKNLKAERKDSAGIEKLPIVVGEKLVNLTPPNLAELLTKTWYQLEGLADVYFKYSPREIRYDKVHETTQDMNNLEQVRIQRKPGIYTLKRIREDIANGSDLKARFLAMIVA
jgi:hypothetical protein